jgi:hypothetical protein
MTGDSRGWTAAPIHTVLLALLFPAYLLATNVDQWVDLSVAWLPIGFSVLGGLLLLVVCARLFGGWGRGGLVASLLLLLFFTFGHVRLAVAGIGVGSGLLAAIWLPVALAGLTLIGRGPRHIVAATQALNLIALMLVAMNLATVGLFIWDQAGNSRGIGQAHAAVPVAPVRRTPDMYYLVFDRYANAETLQRFFGFDNEPFLAELSDRGFVVGRESWANYGGTALSMVSSLSMEYLDEQALSVTEPATYGPIHAALRGHLAVPETLTTIGYEYVHVGNWWEPGIANVDADEVLLYRRESAFATALLETTALTLVAGLDPPPGIGESREIGRANRDHTLFEFEQVEAAASRPGPTYVFAHFLVPHPPYVFNADGSAPSVAQTASRGPREAYLEQLQWTNDRILALLDVLLDVPPGEEPVIVLQADEGPYPDRYQADQDRFPWLDATPAEIQEKFGILNALRLPGLGEAELSQAGFTDRTSPVNTFRLIFAEYFGADLPMLEDRTYLSPDKAHLYRFTLYSRPTDSPGAALGCESCAW